MFAQFVQSAQVMPLPNDDAMLLELTTATARVAIAPAIGGSIASFTHGGRAVLRTTASSALSARDVRGLACYPLVPYSNRIRDAELRFAGRRYALARNFGSHPHSIHGVGWQRAWTVAEHTGNHARLVLAHEARGDDARAWPWDFEATQAFRLTDPGDGAALLMATIALRNTGSEPFPFGLGFHPFFPKHARTRLHFAVAGVWRNDPTQLPQALEAIPSAWRFDPPRALGATALDNVFTGWHGVATLADAAQASTRIDADRALGFLVVYAPHGADFVAVEPVSHETDAFNRSADGALRTGMRVLAPGSAFSCTMRISAVVAGAAAASSPR
jgi:aldose 1-epimerase